MRKLVIQNLILVFMLAACGDENSQYPSVDAGPDAPILVTPDGVSSDLWVAFENFSPQTPSPPIDTTNKWVGDASAIQFGQYLFFEPALSGNGEVSCATCHQPDHGFASELGLSNEGVQGESLRLGRHTPTLLNVGYFSWQFWDGRRDTLWGQAIVPMENPAEMGGSRAQLTHFIYETPAVKAAYERLFGTLPEIGDFPRRAAPVANPTNGDEIGLNDAWTAMPTEQQDIVNQVTSNAIKAIAAYEMELVKFDSPFDNYVQQMRDFPTEPVKWNAISQEAKDGAQLFVEVIGCAKCHNGPLLSDSQFHNLRLPPVDGVDVNSLGRFEGVKMSQEADFSSRSPYSDDPEGQRAMLLKALPTLERDKGAFRTAGLRNLLSTWPYMHGGHFVDLDEVLNFYNEQPESVGVGTRSYLIRELKLEDEQLSKVKAFLESLEGAPLSDALGAQPPMP